MQHIRQPNPWEHIAVFDDAMLLRWIKTYTEEKLPAAKNRVRDAVKDHKRDQNMLTGLEHEARRRGLIE